MRKYSAEDNVRYIRSRIQRETARRSALSSGPVSIVVDGAEVLKLSGPRGSITLKRGARMVDIVAHDNDGQVFIDSYLLTHDEPKTEVWNVLLPWGEEIVFTFDNGEDDCVRAEVEVTKSLKVGDLDPWVQFHKHNFNVQAYLASVGVAIKIAAYRRSEKAFSQGDPATDVMYIQKGGVKLSVDKEIGKESVVAILGPGDFFGEGGIAGQTARMATATAITPTTLLVIENNEMTRVLRAEHAFSDHFVSYMLLRNIRIEEDLIDQLFNSSEKRLARTLLLLARYGEEHQPHGVLHKVSRETLAEMIGTKRSMVNVFLNKFRKLGFIQYNNRGLQVHNSLLSVFLHE
jgi:CRP/FNR family cyclic AMP-dependent transcriptional regulator